MSQECPNVDITNEWGEGFNARLPFTVDHNTDSSWTIHLGFDAKVDKLDCYQGRVSTSDGMNFDIDNLDWDGDLENGDTFTVEMLGYFSGGSRPKMVSATIDNQDICSS